MRFLIGAAVFLLPGVALAAQFAPGALFLSQSPVTAGDSVRIYAVVSNTATSTFSGTLVFKEGDSELGSVAVTIDVGSVQTLSTAWTPTAGTHTIVADLEAQGGSVAQEQTATFDVQAPPTPASDADSASSVATVESSQGIQNEIGSVSPQVQSAVAPAFNFVDGARQSAADLIDGQIAQVQPKVAPLPLPGQSDSGNTTVPSQSSWFSSIFYTIYFYILTILKFVVDSAAVFYPVVALIFLYFLWSMFRRFRRA